MEFISVPHTIQYNVTRSDATQHTHTQTRECKDVNTVPTSPRLDERRTAGQIEPEAELSPTSFEWYGIFETPKDS